MRFVIIGAGMAGVLAAVELERAGYDDIVVYEKAHRLGGTWRENTYPGIACDVPSHLYSYSFAPNPDWSHTFAPGAEILAYLDDVARRHGVVDRIRFGTKVTALSWRGGRWRVETATGETDEADVVIAATGVLHHPRLPDLPGLDDFAGAAFHSARWDHDVALASARLGVVGTGSSAVQIVGALVDVVGELVLFQRTAQWILPIPNRPIAEEDRARYHADPTALTARRAELAATFAAGFADAVIDADSEAVRQLEAMCRANLEDNVIDAALRDQLRPDYRAACKRLVLAPDFYGAIQRPNARVVTSSIDRIEAAGVRTADGELHELDVLVLATGFRVDRFLRPIDVVGRDGVRLADVWAERPSAYLSVAIPDFPNLFLINGPNGPIGNFSLIDVAEAQVGYVLQLVSLLRDGRCRAISARADAASRFEAARVEAAARTVWVTGCRSWYLDDRGVPAAWPWTRARFNEVMASPDLDDWELV